MLARILERSTRVQWDIVTASYTEHRAWLERVDRFWIDGTEYAAECNGVLEVDPDSGLITAFRDYVDLGVWRAKVGDALR
jgi:limonene-1,2-epoxide hydrolase